MIRDRLFQIRGPYLCESLTILRICSLQSHVDDGLLELIPTAVTDEHNEELLRLPTLEGQTLFGFSSASAPGNGFSGHFFTTCWDIVQECVYKAVIDFFERLTHLLFSTYAED